MQACFSYAEDNKLMPIKFLIGTGSYDLVEICHNWPEMYAGCLAQLQNDSRVLFVEDDDKRLTGGLCRLTGAELSGEHVELTYDEGAVKARVPLSQCLERFPRLARRLVQAQQQSFTLDSRNGVAYA